MALFKEKMRAEKLAFMLLLYSVQGHLETNDGHSFAMGPQLWPRPSDVQDPFKKQMEICFLRGWAMFFVLQHIVPEKSREAVMVERYASLWETSWATNTLSSVRNGRLLKRSMMERGSLQTQGLAGMFLAQPI